MHRNIFKQFLMILFAASATSCWAVQLNCDAMPTKVAKLTCQKNQTKIQAMEKERAQKKQMAQAKKEEDATYQGRTLYKKNSASGQSSRAVSRVAGHRKDNKKAKHYRKNSHASRMHAKRTARRETQAKRRASMQQRAAQVAAQTAKKVEDAKKSKGTSAGKQRVSVDSNMVKSFKADNVATGANAGSSSDYQDFSGLQVSSREGEKSQQEGFWSYY